MDAFDSVFVSGKGVKASVSCKLADGTTRSAKLADGLAPAAMTLDAFAEIGMSGTTLGRRGTDKGAKLSMSVGVTGAAAKSAILAMADPAHTPAPTEEPKPKPKNRIAQPSANGTHPPEPAPVA